MRGNSNIKRVTLFGPPCTCTFVIRVYYNIYLFTRCSDKKHPFSFFHNSVTDERMFTATAQSNSGGTGQVSREPESQPSHKLCLPLLCLAGTCKSHQTIAAGAWARSFWAILGAATVQVVFSDDVHRASGNWQHRLRPPSLLSEHISWRHRYITTTKEYLINGQILNLHWFSYSC